ALLDDVAGAVGAEPVSSVILSADFNASFTQVGLRRQGILILGLSLWEVLEPSERIALLGHEFGHAVNGDPRRGLVIGAALRSLATWYNLLRPHRLGTPSYSGNSITLTSEWIARNVILRPVGWLVRAVYTGLERILFQDSQRAEYLADQLAVQVAGAAALRGVLD